MDEIIAVILQVVNAFNKADIQYAIGGSVASSLYGLPRTTHDVDFLVDLHESQLQDFIVALGSDFYVDVDMLQDAIRQKTPCNIIHQQSMLKVDLFFANARNLEELKRTVLTQLTTEPQSEVSVVSPEDIILEKLKWYELGGKTSERQLTDVVGVLRVQKGKLDQAYLENEAKAQGLENMLTKVQILAQEYPPRA